MGRSNDKHGRDFGRNKCWMCGMQLRRRSTCVAPVSDIRRAEVESENTCGGGGSEIAGGGDSAAVDEGGET